MGGKWIVARVDVHSSLGLSLKKSYSVVSVPGFVMFESNGQVIDKSYSLPDYVRLISIESDSSQ